MESWPARASPFRRLLFETSLGARRPWKRNLEQLRGWQLLDERATRTLQERLLERILEHAARHVPYYRDLFRTRGLASGDGRQRIRGLSEIPCLDRATLRREFDRLRSDDLPSRSWRVNGTGGSTGEPVRFLQDRESDLWRTAVERLFDEWSGALPGVRRARLWGSERDLLVGRETWKARLYRWRRNEMSLNSFRMSAERMRAYAQRLDIWRPVYLVGYADSLYEFCRFLESNRLAIHSPASIMSSSGTLLPEQRQTIERALGAPVFDRYAAREFGAIAAEDRAHDGLLVAPEKWVEVLRPDGSPAAPGEEGEVVITSLTNYAMPLLRYRIGDRARLPDLPLARTGWPVLAQVTGRIADTFLRPDGGIVSSLYFIHLVGVVLKAGWIRRIQIVQEDFSRIVVHMVLEPSLISGSAELARRTGELAEKIRAAMGENCSVAFQIRDEIPCEASGKFRYAIRRFER